MNLTIKPDLYADWLNAKEAEKKAVEIRRKIEDDLVKSWGVDPSKERGTKNFNSDGYKLKVTFRNEKKVDATVLKELAAESGLDAHLDALFRWKAEVNEKAWNTAAENITGPLLGAITTKPGRPSFAVERVEKDEE